MKLESAVVNVTADGRKRVNTISHHSEIVFSLRFEEPLSFHFTVSQLKFHFELK